MIKINLLPYRAARRKENIRQQISIFLLLLIFALFGLTYSHIHLTGKVSDAKERLTSTENELKTYEEKVALVDSLKQKLALLDQKLDVMSKLNTDRKAPLTMLNTVKKATFKEHLFLTQLDDTEDSVFIRGIAMDNKTVATFMTRIEQSDFFSSADLENIILEDMENMKLKQFDLRCSKTL